MNYHQDQLNFFKSKVGTIEIETVNDTTEPLTITGKIPESTETDCPICAKAYNPICAQDNNGTLKTFITEDCMEADVCNNGATWSLMSFGICDGDDDFMKDSLVKPMDSGDDFEIPILTESNPEKADICPGCSKTYEPICASHVNTSVEGGEILEKSFNSLECMESFNCVNMSEWKKKADGPCEGDDDFMADLLSKPMTDDFEIPISQ